MIVLSIDQANKAGWALFDNEKLIKYDVEDFEQYKDYTEKISNIKKWLNKTIKKYQPEICSIEDIQFQNNYDTYRKLAELKGVLENNLFEKEFLYFTIPASQWRSTCGVKGRKREEQKKNAQIFVKNKFNIDVGEDEADAICQGWHVVTKIVPQIIKGDK